MIEADMLPGASGADAFAASGMFGCMVPIQARDTIIDDTRAWRADTVGDATSWVWQLPDDWLASLTDLNREQRVPVTEIRLRESIRNTLREPLQPVCDSLESGRGFVILDRLRVERDSLVQVLESYWLIGQSLGQPFEQNIEGTLLYDVRDTGRDVAQGARFSVTNAESSFHTDSAFSQRMPDYVGLLCLKTAKSGGRSQLVSAYSLHNALLANHPDVLEILSQPFLFDRRGQFNEGELSYGSYPILCWDDHELTARYLHYYIQVGHESAKQPLTVDQRRALDVLQDLLDGDEFRVQFDLEPGQLLFTNNHWILHNRTSFEDHPDPQDRRHFVRLWLVRTS